MRGDSKQCPLPLAEEESAGGPVSDSIPLSMFSCPGAAGFKVRGPTYLQDKKKVARSWHLCQLPAVLTCCESASTGQDMSAHVRGVQGICAEGKKQTAVSTVGDVCLLVHPRLQQYCPAVLTWSAWVVGRPFLSWLDEGGCVSVVSLCQSYAARDKLAALGLFTQ
jgi:hypothetical protein